MIELDDYTGLYFFSALFQGNASLLAILGVFIIYRLQDLKSRVATIRTYMLEFGHLFDLSVDKQTLQKFDSATIEDKNKLIDSIPSQLKPDFLRWCEFETIIGSWSEKTVRPTISLGLIIAFSIFGMIFAKFIHTSLRSIELWILIAIALWNTLTIGFIVWRVIYSIKK